MKMYALKAMFERDMLFVRRARGRQGIETKFVDDLEHATFYPKRAQAAQVQRHSKFSLTVITVDVTAKETEE